MIWAFYRSSLGISQNNLFDELIFKPLVFFLPVYIYVTRFEKLSFGKSLFFKRSQIYSDIRFSLLVALPVLLSGIFVFLYTHMVLDIYKISLFIIVSAFAAFTEETISRGFVARHIWQETANIYKTVFQASILHIFLRIPRIMTMPELFGQKLIYYFSAEIIMSIVVTTIFVYRKSILPVYLIRFVAVFVLMLLMLG
jgi:hypothetical protein